jgi:DNA-binding beta-propeller fold protein YncE
MKSGLARTAAVALLVGALTAGTASAATPSAYVYATSWSQTVRQYSADDAGLLADLTPPEIGDVGVTSVAAAASPDRRSLYVANQTSGTVSQFDIAADGTLSAKTPSSVGTGSSPLGIAVSPDGRHVYVVNQGDRTVGVYSADAAGALTLASTAPAGRGASQIALAPDGGSAYVTNLTDGTVSQYDVGAEGSLTAKDPAAVPSGTRPSGIAVSADGASVYVTNQVAAGTVSQFSVAAGTGALSAKDPATVAAGSQPRGIVARSGHVYVANSGASTISRYDAGADGALSALAPALSTVAGPQGLALSPDGDSLYVAGFTGGVVGQYDVGAGGALAAKAPESVGANASPVAVVAVKPRDVTSPTIDLATPADGAEYVQGDDVAAAYTCADEGGSGLQSCTGDVPNGAAIDTSAVGGHDFTVTARDGEGNETTVTNSYTVTEPPPPPPDPGLGFEGFVGSIHDGSVVSAGDEVPVVFSLGGFRGRDVLADGSPTSVQADCDDPGQPTGGEAAWSKRGLTFNRWTGHYVFQWQTKKSWAGTCRTFVLALRDGSVERLTVSFRPGWHRHW